MPVEPRKATTVILVRESSTRRGFEIFLLRRHEKNAFMGGFFVYPGGKVDPADWDTACFAVSDEAFRAREWVANGVLCRDENLAHRAAAVREVFEESGVLLACCRTGPLQFSEKQLKKRFAGHRALLHKKEASFTDMIKKEALQLALHDLYYYAHWITPEAQTHRFDTHFFIARYPDDQEASPDLWETTQGIWLAPEEALKENKEKRVPLSPPTLITMENLSRFRSADEVFASLSSAPVRTVLPDLILPPGDTLLIFPWDPEYERYKRGRPEGPADHGRPSRPEDTTTRLIMTEGRWLPYCKQ